MKNSHLYGISAMLLVNCRTVIFKSAEVSISRLLTLSSTWSSVNVVSNECLPTFLFVLQNSLSPWTIIVSFFDGFSFVSCCTVVIIVFRSTSALNSWAEIIFKMKCSSVNLSDSWIYTKIVGTKMEVRSILRAQSISSIYIFVVLYKCLLIFALPSN